MAALFPKAPSSLGQWPVWGHQDAFLRQRLTACYRSSQRTFAGTRGNVRDAPTPVNRMPVAAPNISTRCGQSRRSATLGSDAPKAAPSDPYKPMLRDGLWLLSPLER
jgi:hypothetical protein